jgi:hypothetical protein
MHNDDFKKIILLELCELVAQHFYCLAEMGHQKWPPALFKFFLKNKHLTC